MNRKKWVSIGIIGVVVASLAVTAVTASLRAFSTPLYTVRMEQASKEMNFLPTEMNGFTYTTEKGYILDYNILGQCDYAAPAICGYTCPETCRYTCEQTCPGVCVDTQNTCEGQICPQTSWYTCKLTCPGVCPPYTS